MEELIPGLDQPEKNEGFSRYDADNLVFMLNEDQAEILRSCLSKIDEQDTKIEQMQKALKNISCIAKMCDEPDFNQALLKIHKIARETIESCKNE